ncbi:MAG: hypothetical protein ACM3ON_12025 [Chloroflexota bacterium]
MKWVIVMSASWLSLFLFTALAIAEESCQGSGMYVRNLMAVSL